MIISFRIIVIKFFLLLFFFSPTLSRAQYSQPVARLADSIGKVEDQFIERSSDFFIEHEMLGMLKNRVTRAELTGLTGHPHPAVRCYAFWALSDASTDTLIKIIQSHVNDTDKVRNFFSTYGSQQVPDVFVSLLQQRASLKKELALDSHQENYLDSVLIFSDNKPLYARSASIHRAALRKEWHTRIREIVVKGLDHRAAISLALFQKEVDLPLIYKLRGYEKIYNTYNLDVWYMAVREFPHVEFQDSLEHDLDESFRRTFYDATLSGLYYTIALYRNDWSSGLLTSSHDKALKVDSLKKHISYIMSALSQIRDSVYDNLYWKFFEVHEEPLHYEYLSAQDAKRAYRAMKKCIVDLPVKYKDQPYFGTVVGFPLTSMSTDTIPDIYARMLDTIYKKEPQNAKELIAAGIRSANISILPLYLNAAIKLKLPEFIEPLFSRLSRENEAEIYFPLAISLLEYRDKKVNTRLKPALKKGGYEWEDESIQEMFRQYGAE